MNSDTAPPATPRYPTERIRLLRLADGTAVVLRPLWPQDAPLLGEWFERQPPAERRRRFHGAVGRLSPQRLAQLTDVDHRQHVAFVVVQSDGVVERVLGEARYHRHEPDSPDAEFAILVDAGWRHRGLGAQVLQALMHCAAAQGVQRLIGRVEPDNHAMQALGLDCGFALERGPVDDPEVRLVLELPPAAVLATLPPQGRRSWLRRAVAGLHHITGGGRAGPPALPPAAGLVIEPIAGVGR